MNNREKAKENQEINRSKSLIYQLNKDVLFSIFKLLSAREVAQNERAGTLFRGASLANNQQFWRVKVEKDFPPSHLYKEIKDVTPKETYAKIFVQTSYFVVPVKSLLNTALIKKLNLFEARVEYLNDLIRTKQNFNKLGVAYKRISYDTVKCETDSLITIADFIKNEAPKNSHNILSNDAIPRYCRDLLIIEFKLTKDKLKEYVNANQLKEALMFAHAVGAFSEQSEKEIIVHEKNVSDLKYLSLPVKFENTSLVIKPVEENTISIKKSY